MVFVLSTGETDEADWLLISFIFYQTGGDFATQDTAEAVTGQEQSQKLSFTGCRGCFVQKNEVKSGCLSDC